MKCAHGENSISYISLMLFKVVENSSAFFRQFVMLPNLTHGVEERSQNVNHVACEG